MAIAQNILTFAIGVKDSVDSELRLIANGGVSNERVSEVGDFEALDDIIDSLTTEISYSLEGIQYILSTYTLPNSGKPCLKVNNLVQWFSTFHGPRPPYRGPPAPVPQCSQ